MKKLKLTALASAIILDLAACSGGGTTVPM